MLNAGIVQIKGATVEVTKLREFLYTDLLQGFLLHQCDKPIIQQLASAASAAVFGRKSSAHSLMSFLHNFNMAVARENSQDFFKVYHHIG